MAFLDEQVSESNDKEWEFQKMRESIELEEIKMMVIEAKKELDELYSQLFGSLEKGMANWL